MKRCRKCKVPLEGTVSKIIKKVLRTYPSEQDAGLCNRCAAKEKPGTYVCQICDRSIDEASALTHVKAEEYLLHLIRKDHPEWKESKGTCPECIDYYRQLIKKARI